MRNKHSNWIICRLQLHMGIAGPTERRGVKKTEVWDGAKSWVGLQLGAQEKGFDSREMNQADSIGLKWLRTMRADWLGK
jgi:hypothetical protein